MTTEASDEDIFHAVRCQILECRKQWVRDGGKGKPPIVTSLSLPLWLKFTRFVRRLNGLGPEIIISLNPFEFECTEVRVLHSVDEVAVTRITNQHT